MTDKPFKIQIELLLYFPSEAEARSLANEILGSLKEDYIADYDKESVILRQLYQFDKDYEDWKRIRND